MGFIFITIHERSLRYLPRAEVSYKRSKESQIHKIPAHFHRLKSTINDTSSLRCFDPVKVLLLTFYEILLYYFAIMVVVLLLLVLVGVGVGWGALRYTGPCCSPHRPGIAFLGHTGDKDGVHPRVLQGRKMPTHTEALRSSLRSQ